jgi:hypothetical protein
MQGVVALGAVGACLGLGTTTAGAKTSVVARGLDNPRGLDIGPRGTLYVTEAGRGGTGPCIPGPEGGEVCFGPTGAVTRIDLARRRATTVVRGLPSLAARDGSRAIGPSDVSFAAGSTGYLTVGLGANPSVRGQLPAAAARMAGLFRMGRGGRLTRIADLGAFEATANPDAAQPGATVDTNPNSVDATNPRRIVVADAGGNDLVRVTPAGRASVLATFPFTSAPAPDVAGAPPATPGTTIPVQPVPTSVVRGRDGAYYVGELTGFPFPARAARVWRVPVAGTPTVFAKGLTQVTDVAFGPDRSLYVLEIATSPMVGPPSRGALIRIPPGGKGKPRQIAAGRLDNPTGLVIDRRYAYVSNRGASPGKGQVLRITLPRR